jgi:hypothetical protein
MSITVMTHRRLSPPVPLQTTMIFPEKATLPLMISPPPERPAPFEANARIPDGANDAPPLAPLISPAEKDPAPEPAPDAAQTLDEVAERILTARWPKYKIAETISGLRTIARALGRPLAEIPADPFQLRPLLTSASPFQVGITADRWARSRGLVIRALAAAGVVVMPGRSIVGLSSAWLDLYNRLPDKKCRHGLSRILSFCSRRHRTCGF